MARRIVWSKLALENKASIFRYWNTKNGFNSYARKLEKLFNSSIETVSKYPKIGLLTEDKDIRIRIVKDYLLIYEILDDEILDLTIGIPDKIRMTSIDFLKK